MSDASKMLVCPGCAGLNRVPTAKLAAQPKCGKCQADLLRAVPLDVNQGQFERFLAKDQSLLLVDFWADWCGPCKMMAPAFAQAAKALSPDVRLLKVSTETEQALAARFNIRSIPTLALFRDGKEIARQPGAMDASGIQAWVAANRE